MLMVLLMLVFSSLVFLVLIFFSVYLCCA